MMTVAVLACKSLKAKQPVQTNGIYKSVSDCNNTVLLGKISHSSISKVACLNVKQKTVPYYFLAGQACINKPYFFLPR